VKTLALACVPAVAPAAAQDVRDALKAGDLICEFGEGAPRTSELLLVYETVTAHSAQVLSTHAPGRRPVRVKATDEAVHFIERVGPSFRVTTLTACERHALRGGVPTCVRYAAKHAWHFDARALTDPDRAFADLPAGIAAGRCEPWRIN